MSTPTACRDGSGPAPGRKRVASVLLRHCSGIAPGLRACWSLVQPSYIRCTTVVHAFCIYWVLRSLPALRCTGAEAKGAIHLTAGGERQEKIRHFFGADVLRRTGLLIDDQGISAVVGEPSSALMPLPSSELHSQPAALGVCERGPFAVALGRVEVEGIGA